MDGHGHEASEEMSCVPREATAAKADLDAFVSGEVMQDAAT